MKALPSPAAPGPGEGLAVFGVGVRERCCPSPHGGAFSPFPVSAGSDPERAWWPCFHVSVTVTCYFWAQSQLPPGAFSSPECETISRT